VCPGKNAHTHLDLTDSARGKDAEFAMLKCRNSFPAMLALVNRSGAVQITNADNDMALISTQRRYNKQQDTRHFL
jgi:hypothetical protein